MFSSLTVLKNQYYLMRNTDLEHSEESDTCLILNLFVFRSGLSDVPNQNDSKYCLSKVLD